MYKGYATQAVSNCHVIKLRKSVKLKLKIDLCKVLFNARRVDVDVPWETFLC